MTKPQYLHLSHLHIGYNEPRRPSKTILSNLNTFLQAGQLTCLLGANGVGKSTLLRTLSGIQPPLSGDILLKNETQDNAELNLRSISHKQMARIVSVVLTQRTELQNLTVKELVELGRTPYTNFWGTLTQKDNVIVQQAIEQVGITHLAERSITKLSDGERQKTMIAKALAQTTPIILLDEPTAFLDFPSKVEILQLLHHLAHATHKIILLSTHDLELALQMADQLWLCTSDKTLVTGSPQELTQNGQLKVFIEQEHIKFEDGHVLVNM